MSYAAQGTAAWPRTGESAALTDELVSSRETPSTAAGSAAGPEAVSHLLARARTGDAAAWAVITDRYTGLLWAVARAMGLSAADAADAVQTTWLRLVENLGSVRNPDALGAWLATTARRECLAAKRRAARTVAGLDEPALERLLERGGAAGVQSPRPDPEQALLRSEREKALVRAFRCLSPDCQGLLRALLAEPRPTYAAVAAALDMPIGSIGPTRGRCLSRLRAILTAELAAELTAEAAVETTDAGS
jgi:RNA polymerase sigma factor (sigma-70 family)